MAHVHSHPEDKYRDSQLHVYLEPTERRCNRPNLDESATEKKPGRWVGSPAGFQVWEENK